MFLGIEIGGTKLQLGIGLGDGTLAAFWRGTVDVAAGPDGIRRQIVENIPGLLQKANLERHNVRGVGIGFGGPVDDSSHTIIKSHQIEGWDDFPLADWITEITGWPAALGNDADVAGLAEALFGAGKGLSPILYITIGSGIGGGLIIDGEIYRGCGRGAAEIGHTIVFAAFEGEREAWEWGPLEAFSSGWAIEEFARSRVAHDADPDSALFQKEVITSKDVGEAAAEGRAVALAILDRAVHYLAGGICQIIALLCPRRIIIGGGVSLMGEKVLFEPLRKRVAEQVFAPFSNCYDIVPAALGEEVVVHGALALARRKFKNL